MTPSELVEEAALRLGDPAGLSIPYRVLYRLASRAQRRISELTHCTRKIYSVTTVANTSRYLMPDRFLKEFTVISTNEDGDTRRIKPRRPHRAHGVRPQSYGDEWFYYMEGETYAENDRAARVYLNLWPTPSGGGDVLNVHMALQARDLVESDSQLDTPEIVHEAVLYELLAAAVPLPGSEVQQSVTYYRGLADRAITEVKRNVALRLGDVGEVTPATF